MLIKRLIFDELVEDINKKNVSILLGTRQVGKTTLLKQIEAYCQKQELKTTFFDFEQPQTLSLFNKSEQEIIDYLISLGGTIFIDEFHYLKNASKIFKAISDRAAGVKIFASGSSSIEIHKHLKESLAGRKREYVVYPLTWNELSGHNSTKEDYLVYGGLPGLLHESSDKNKQALIDEILKGYILKDIKSLIKEENIRAFNHLMYLLAENQGQLVSANSLSNDIKLSVKAVNNYLDILSQTFVIYQLPSYSTNQGNELKKSQKIYLYDLGLRNMLLQDFSSLTKRSDGGAILEGFLTQNIMPILEKNMSLKFWRTRDGKEVDFILVKDRKPVPIEIKTNWEVKHGIPDGLRIFFGRYKSVKLGYVFSLNKKEEEINYEGRKVFFKNIFNLSGLAPLI